MPNSTKAQLLAENRKLARRIAALERARKKDAALSESRYDIAMRAINEGVYDWDIAKGTIYYSERVQAATGMDPEAMRTPEDWRSRIHPEDLPAYERALTDHFKGRTERFEVEYRYRGSDGAWRWARQHGIAVRDPQGRAVRLVGSTGEITSLKRVEAALKASEERYALAMRVATEGIYDWDVATGDLYLSDKAREFWGFAPGPLKNTDWLEHLHPEDAPGYRQAIIEHFKGRRPHIEHELRVRNAKGQFCWVIDRGIAVRDKQGRATRLVGATSDVTQRKRNEEALRVAHGEAKEALERQTATAEILKVIAASPSDVRPVFDAIARNAQRLLGGRSSMVTLVNGENLDLVAFTSTGAEGDEVLKAIRSRPLSATHDIHCRAAVSGTPEFQADIEADPQATPEGRAMARARGFRSVLSVPMMRDGVAVGTIGVTRAKAGDFSERDLSLMKTFADQAVIAIENVRLFNETTEALERQTATAEILKVIAASPSDVQPVFDAIAASAMRLIRGQSAAVTRVVADAVHLVALTSTSPAGDEALKKFFPVPVSHPRSLHARVARSGEPAIRTDTEKDPNMIESGRELARTRGYRSDLVVPMLQDGAAIGAISVTRSEPGEFSEHQVNLLKTFADQAVIAIENVRLFNETKEALERQTATSDILASMSGSMTDARPVFDAIVRNLMSLFNTKYAVVQLLHDGVVEMPAAGGDPGFERIRDNYPRPLDRSTGGGVAMIEKRTFQISSLADNPDAPETMRRFAREFGFDAGLFAPMLREGSVIGAVGFGNREAKVFDAKEVALLETFAAQAVIAIENVRLFNGTKEALEQQTATAEILKVISASPSDVQPVLETVVANAARLCEAGDVLLHLREGDSLRCRAHYGKLPTSIKVGALRPISRQWVGGLAVCENRQLHITDLLVRADEFPESNTDEPTRQAGIRTVLATPLMREGTAIGTIVMRRTEVRPFGDKQVELLNTFADQAVIAIENVRLFNETKEALERQTATAEILKVIAESPTDTQPVFDAIARSGARLVNGMNVALLLRQGSEVVVKGYSAPGREDLPEEVRRLPLDREKNFPSQVILEGKVLEIPDWEGEGIPEFERSVAKAYGVKAVLQVPMLRKGEGIGAIVVTRATTGAFDPKDVALLQSFADQAVIAIENVRLFNETKEALERQTATAEILKVIASSPSDVQPVFDTIASSAMQLIEAHSAAVWRLTGDKLHLAALTSTDGSGDDALKGRPPVDLTGGNANTKAVRTGRPAFISDTENDADVGQELREIARARGFRSVLAVPMLREGSVVGTITVTRKAPGPFAEHEIDLLRTFGDQAVIATENVRLFNETKEALEQQTATAEILKVMGGSPTNTSPVFEAIANSALRIFNGKGVAVVLVDADEIESVAEVGSVPNPQPSFRMPLTRDSTSGRAILDRTVVNFRDTEAPDAPPYARANGRARGVRSIAGAPMLRNGVGIGAIVVLGEKPGGLSEKHVELLQTFADQAVIAIENVRLFNETKEALDRQTATAEILKVISGSPTDTQPIFDAIVRSAVRLCSAVYSAGLLLEGNLIHLVSHHNWVGEGLAAAQHLFPITTDRDLLTAQAIREGRVMYVQNMQTDPGVPAESRELAIATGYRTQLIVPMLRGVRAIGAIVVAKAEGPFSEKQISLLQTFADQAVIAIENVRLFKELESRTGALSQSVQKLTALGEVGQAISSTLDLDTVLKTIVSRATQLTGLDGGAIYEYDAARQEFRLQTAEHLAEELVQAARDEPIRLGNGAIGQAGLTREPVQVPDTLADSYQSDRKAVLNRVGYRALVAVPLLREDNLLGALLVTRRAPGAFPQETVALLQTFATQSAMAIQNARLFREIAEKGRQLEAASRHKSDFLASMSHELRTPLNAILGFNELILGEIYGPVPEEMKEPLTDIQASGKHLLRLINNVLDLAKIEAGRMELALADYSVHDTVESVRSTLRPLAAEKGLDFIATVPEDIPLAHGDFGRITQCLMNLAGNSLKFTKEGKVEIAVQLREGVLVYQVNDTGIGIPPDKIGNLFTEFKQTDATIASEYGGTGLGLSISKKFIEMHGGRVWVESEVGKGSSFVFEVPLRAGAAREAGS